MQEKNKSSNGKAAEKTIRKHRKQNKGKTRDSLSGATRARRVGSFSLAFLQKWKKKEAKNSNGKASVKNPKHMIPA